MHHGRAAKRRGCRGSPPAVSFDGRYEGSVQVASSASGTDPHACETEPQISLTVKNNSFVYAQRHPRVAGTAPGLTEEKTTAVYNAAISPEGIISGTSATSGTMSGQVTGSHMSGRISGLLCGYTFSADRV